MIVLIVVVVLLVIALVAAGVMLSRRRRSQKLQERYGPEYDRALADTGDPKEAEARLTEREQRVRSLDVRELRPEEREQFAASWDTVQRGFVDDPVQSLRHADALVVDVMRTRGYPVDDFERRAEDISVEHPEVVARYREARSVREAVERGTVDTEQQRHALTSYRSLIEALIGRDSSPRHSREQADPRTNGSPATGRTDAPTSEETTR
ncbi:MAG: hypothetical protein L0H64_23570 [Pseudonocardia sp.]|nr:hypothetical protein [Pseudonocardia sp.]